MQKKEEEAANSAKASEGIKKRKHLTAWYSKHNIQFTGTSLGFISFT